MSSLKVWYFPNEFLNEILKMTCPIKLVFSNLKGRGICDVEEEDSCKVGVDNAGETGVEVRTADKRSHYGPSTYSPY